MIRAAAMTKDGRPLVILGLSDTNLERLQAGEPIVLKLDELVPSLVGDLLIFTGRDEQQMADDVMAGLIGPETKLRVPFTPANDVFKGR